MASLKQGIARMALKALGFNVPQTTSYSSLNLWRSWLGQKAIYRSWDEKDWVAKGFLANPNLFAIVNRITSTAALAPFSVYRIKNEQKAYKYKTWTGANATDASIQKAIQIKAEAYELIENHPLQDLIDRPNEWQRDDEFTQTCIGFKLLTGERFLYTPKLDGGANTGKIITITNLPPGCMVVKSGESMFQIGSYELHIGTIIPIEKDNIIFSRYWNPVYDMSGSHLRGLSPLRSANKLLDRMEAAQDRSTIMLQAAGAAGLLYDKMTSRGVAPLTPAQVADMKRMVNTEVLGTENSGRIAIAEGDIGYINFGLSAVDLALLEQEKWSLEMLCNIFKVPAGLFFASANATDNNIQAWNKQLISQAVIPALSDLRDDWNEIAATYGEDVYVDYDITVFPEMQDDLNVTATRLEKTWYMTGNEKRLAMGMDEDTENPMMDTYLVPSSLKEISDLDPANVDREMDRIDREMAREQNDNDDNSI